jgi:hypothetical protein
MKKYQYKIVGQYDHIAKKIANMSTDEVMKSLYSAGIITKNGKLRVKYRRRNKKTGVS